MVKYEKLEKVKPNTEEQTLLTPQQAQEEIEKLIEKARNMVSFCDKGDFDKGHSYCPVGEYWGIKRSGEYEHRIDRYGCFADARIEGNKIIFGVQCTHPRARELDSEERSWPHPHTRDSIIKNGFYSQGEIPIQKYLREYI